MQRNNLSMLGFAMRVALSIVLMRVELTLGHLLALGTFIMTRIGISLRGVRRKALSSVSWVRTGKRLGVI